MILSPQGVLLKNNLKILKYYTGFENIDHFIIYFFKFQNPGPAAHDLNSMCNLLSPNDQLFLVMIKLRHKQTIALKLVKASECTESNIIVAWIYFMYF